ncbi:MAG: ABC-type antimicrobial peptide transport system permease subunit, partial [Myxococcota bacterium]
LIGNTVLDTLDQTMSVSIINSISGHLQVYSGDAKDEFEIFKMDSSTPDIGRIDNFADIKAELEALDEVDTVVPMGIDYAVIFAGNILDKRLGELRTALNDKKTEDANVLFEHVRRIVAVLDKELSNLGEVADMEAVMKDSKEEFEALAKTREDKFWDRFKTAPYEVLEFLEDKVAKLAFGEDLIWVNYIGTDTAAFAKSFDRFEIVDGEPIPPGQRGFLFNKLHYERHVKNKQARRLDQIKERLDASDQSTQEAFDDCDDCATWTKQNVSQAASIAYQMDGRAAKASVAALQVGLASEETDLTELIRMLLDLDGSNFSERYKLFYDVIAPNISLYTIPVGATLVLTSFARGGYMRKVPVKVYGTFRFRSLDKSPVAGGFNITDLMTFRELYGLVTAEKLKEIAALKKKYNLEDTEDLSEDALFDDDSTLVESGKSESFDATTESDLKAGGERYTEAVHQRVYTQDEINNGMVLNAAIMLKDGVEVEAARTIVEKVGSAKGLNIKVATWREASGLVGDLIGVTRAVLYSAVAIIFLVALIIINNSMMMSTMERTRELGTMRAMGAPRMLVLRMIFVETAVLALIFGGGGAIAASGLMLYWNAYGLAAWSDFTTFLFAGPRFYPLITWGHFLIAIFMIGLVAILSTVWPAVRAAYITPRAAMAKE